MACFVEQEAKLVVEWNDSVSQLLKVCAFYYCCDFIEYMSIVFGMLVCYFYIIFILFLQRVNSAIEYL